MIINFTNAENINTIENTLNNLLNSNIKIEKEQMNKPKLKVINIDELSKMKTSTTWIASSKYFMYIPIQKQAR